MICQTGRNLADSMKETLSSRIAFFSHSAKLYGANRSLLALIDGLSEEGVEPCVFLPRHGDMVEVLEARGIEHIVIHFRRWMGRSRWRAPLRLAANLLLLPVVSYQLARRNVDIIYSNSSVFPIGAWAAAVTNRPHVWHIREFGSLDFGWEHDLGQKVFEAWLGAADTILAVSRAVRDEVVAGVRGDCRVVYNGVISEARLAELSVPDLEKRDPTLLMVGRIEEAKDQKTAINAFRTIVAEEPKARLCVAGTGQSSYLEELRSLCRRLGVQEKMDIVGYIDDPFELYESSWALLMCSRCEAMGRVTAEAMAAGLPVIGRASCGTKELLTHGETGLLYDGTEQELIDESLRLLRDRLLWRRISRNAREVATREFTNEAYVRRVAGHLEDVVR